MNRGDVVEVNWPYSDLSGSKVRPAVMVRSDFLSTMMTLVGILIVGLAYPENSRAEIEPPPSSVSRSRISLGWGFREMTSASSQQMNEITFIVLKVIDPSLAADLIKKVCYRTNQNVELASLTGLMMVAVKGDEKMIAKTRTILKHMDETASKRGVGVIPKKLTDVDQVREVIEALKVFEFSQP